MVHLALRANVVARDIVRNLTKFSRGRLHGVVSTSSSDMEPPHGPHKACRSQSASGRSYEVISKPDLPTQLARSHPEEA